jgi:hypothetical protein
MAAIITENYRKTLAKLLKENLDNSANAYYVGIGKSDQWYEDLSGGLTAPFPQGTTADSVNVLRALTDLIKIGSANYSRVIPNVSITSTPARYKKFNPYDASCLYPSTINNVLYRPAYFIEPSSGNVFLVLDAPDTGLLSISDDNVFFINGNTGSQREMITTTNGYTVVYIGSININSKFNNAQFVQVNDNIVNGTHKYKGVVYGFHIANGGEYVNTSTMNLSNGTYTGVVTVREYGGKGGRPFNPTLPLEITVECLISSGKITSVKPKFVATNVVYYAAIASDDSSVNAYTFSEATAEITISGTAITPKTVASKATLYPCISNINGFKYDMTEYTPAWYVCFRINSDVATQNVYTSYSQVSLIRNPTSNGSPITLDDAESKNMKKSFTLLNYNPGTIDSTYAIVQKNGSNIVKRIGVVDSHVQTGTGNANAVIYYTNSVKYGYDDPFTTAGNTISFINTTSGNITDTSVVPSTFVNPTINNADVLFIDNRAEINRADDQNEELKIIIQL